jgi:hypothetical protein
LLSLDGSYRINTNGADLRSFPANRLTLLQDRAEQMTDRDARQTMLGIAEDYEKLAKRAEERFKSLPQSK